MRRGVFVIKGSAKPVAKSLAVSRSTIYNYPDELGGCGANSDQRIS